MKIARSFEDSGILLKDVGKTIENEAEEKGNRFLGLLLDAFRC